MTKELPIIDISPWIEISSSSEISSLTEHQRKVSQDWDQAMRRYGFAIIVGHGLEFSLFEELLREGKTFFDQPLSEKFKYNHGKYGHPNGGYTPPGYETVELSMDENQQEENSLKKKPKYDPVENFVFTSSPEKFSLPSGEFNQPFPIAPDYFSQMEKLLSILHRISAAALNLPSLEYFDSFYWPETKDMGRNGNCLRITHYPGTTNPIFSQISTEKSNFERNIRYGAHTDYQGFTILKPDRNDWQEVSFSSEESKNDDIGSNHKVRLGGLEVFVPEENHWIPVQIPKDQNALVVNAGNYR